MPKLTIDGIEIEVEDGLNLIQAASRVGVDVPHFCYHPALSIVAQCRQCLVEVEGVPKVMPACNTFVREGLIVKTNSEKAINARKATVEFTLINHPLDCPICDKGGECPLQLTTVKHGPGYSRFDGPEEKKVRKKYYLSDRILHDPNRCIMCTRCVRFTDEVTKTGELGFNGRAFRKRIVVFPGKDLDNELAGNVIDLCPVGALLNKDNLHEERVWYWKFTDTVCPLCSNGCNITVGADPRMGRASRVRPRTNLEVNNYWICDIGRYNFKAMQTGRRLKDPIIRTGEGFEITTWKNAIEFLTSEIKRIRNYNEEIAIICSPLLTNEDLYMLRKLAGILRIRKIVSKIVEPQGEKKFGLISTDPFPNSTGVRDLILSDNDEDMAGTIDAIAKRQIKAVYMIGEDVIDVIPDGAKTTFTEAAASLSLLVVQDFKLSGTAQLAHVILPGSTPYEKDGTFTNDTGRVQRIKQAIPPPGNAKPDWEIIKLIGNTIEEGSFNYSDPSEIMNEIAEKVPSYKGINYDKIGSLGINRSL